jgi:very-short-patch-repair endonuclease
MPLDLTFWIYCAPAMLAIEVDGEAHSRGYRPARDDARDAWLASQGIQVSRYAAEDLADICPA